MRSQAAKMLDLEFDRAALGDFEHASSLEWLETNGLGGWASATVSGAHTRRYHGLLVAATRPPAGRRLLLAKLEETLLPGTGAGAPVELGSNRFPGAIHPLGFDCLAAFSRERFPVMEFAGEDFRLRKTVCAVGGENTTVVIYELLAGSREMTLELRPLLAGRDIHSLGKADANRVWTADAPRATPGVRFVSAAGEPDLWVEPPGAEYHAGGSWYFDFEYSEEKARGFDFREDLYMPGVFSLRLEPGRPVAVVISTAERPGCDGLELVAAERERRERLLLLADPAGADGVFARRLVLAADQFLVRRAAESGGGATIIAGYPWFADWGRDAMIALPGLCLETGRFVQAREILRAFAAHLSQGMLPNRFPEQGEAPEYNTVDATLWLFVAVERYLGATGDEEFVRGEMLAKLDDILAWHGRGTRFGIRVTADGLLAAGEPGVQLTWMDARVGLEVVTPRHGMAVEVEALWYNALRIAAALHRRFGAGGRAAMLGKLAGVVRQHFEERFWNPDSGALHDVVAGGQSDPSCRPNQIYALALPHPLLPRDKAIRVLATVEERLLTPRGLKSLAADEPGYCPRYAGGPDVRDRAYHQGTVWSFLLGAYIDALVRYRGSAGRRQGRALLAGFAAHLREAGIGTVSEIFDAAAPHAPRGAIAQAWSVGELLRAARKVGLR